MSMLGLLAWCFRETPNVGVGVSLTPLTALGTLLLLLGCFAEPHYVGFCVVLLYLVLP